MFRTTFFIALFTLSTLFFSGCASEYVYIQPDYPKIGIPRKVPNIEGTSIRKKCLYIDERNTNLCGNDLKIVFTTISDLRINDAVFRKNIASYNDFVSKKAKEKSKK